MSADTSSSTTPTYDSLTTKERAWVDALLKFGLNQTAASRALGYKGAEKHGLRMSKNVRVARAVKERVAAAAMDADEVLFRLREQGASTAEDFLTYETVQRCEEVWMPVRMAIAQLEEELAEGREVAHRLGLEGRTAQAHDEEMEAIERRIVRLEVRAERLPAALIRMPGPVTAHIVARIDLVRMRDAGKLHLLKSVTEQKDGSVKVELYDGQAALVHIGKAQGIFGAKGTPDDPIVTETRVTSVVFTTPEPGTVTGDDDEGTDARP